VETRLQALGVSREVRAQLLSHNRTSGVQQKHYERYVVTPGRFTKDAVEFAKGRNVALVDGDQLPAWLAAARKSPASPEFQSGGLQPPTGIEPLCPTCSKPMARRLGRQGANKGKEFWGCGQSCVPRTRPVAS
jgi:ssDNA-binding Zn-finger/Zn-ribbon topoisomerase 1